MVTFRQLDTTAVLRAQLNVLDTISRILNLDRERQRRVLLIDRRDWIPWSKFFLGGPLPANPEVSVMLRRLGIATYRLASLADRLVN